MRKMKISQKNVTEIEKIICNQCGKEIPMVNGRMAAGVCSIHQTWEYGSDKDGETHEIDLCEDCYDKWVTEFQVPVTVE